jgi:hypothetical protein
VPEPYQNLQQLTLANLYLTLELSLPHFCNQALQQALEDVQLSSSIVDKSVKGIQNNHSKDDDDDDDDDDDVTIDVGEYYRAGWTFHAKGIWLFASSTATTTLPPPPHLIDNTTTPISENLTENNNTVTSTTKSSPPNLAVTYIGHDSPLLLRS